MRARVRLLALVISLTSLFPQMALAETEQPVTDGSVPRYVFPFTRVPVRYARDHLDYPATDVFGCYA
ncbi:MAG: hypothetical protein EBY89_04795, partial [Actinobacteria bacterium]|nr:hypothetical protein [Actinomycetota bacterium]